VPGLHLPAPGGCEGIRTPEPSAHVFILPHSCEGIIYICARFGSAGCSLRAPTGLRRRGWRVPTGCRAQLGGGSPRCDTGERCHACHRPCARHELARSVRACAVACQLCSSLLGFRRFGSNKTAGERRRNPSWVNLFATGRRGGGAGLATRGLASSTQPLAGPRRRRLPQLRAKGRVTLPTLLLLHAPACPSMASAVLPSVPTPPGDKTHPGEGWGWPGQQTPVPQGSPSSSVPAPRVRGAVQHLPIPAALPGTPRSCSRSCSRSRAAAGTPRESLPQGRTKTGLCVERLRGMGGKGGRWSKGCYEAVVPQK